MVECKNDGRSQHILSVRYDRQRSVHRNDEEKDQEIGCGCDRVL
jgi:hypothetical protein